MRIQEAYDDALQALRNASDEKASAKSGILVLGEANAGKTRLALEALMSVLPTWPSSIGS